MTMSVGQAEAEKTVEEPRQGAGRRWAAGAGRQAGGTEAGSKYKGVSAQLLPRFVFAGPATFCR